MAAGAKGYLLKKDSDKDLYSAINTTRQGGVMYLQPSPRP
jgi:DNA-binding NarL/FixJ family response regulator